MLHIKEAIVVEGKYDKKRLQNITDAVIIETNGFSLYKDKSVIEAVRHMAKTQGIIILTDSDNAGFRIRSYIKQCVGESGMVKMAYIPQQPGKERRKPRPGKEGLLGVEGIDEATLLDILSKATAVREDAPGRPHDERQITKNTFYEDGLTGRVDSKMRREQLCRTLNLPNRLSATALLDILNKVYGYDEYKKILSNM